MPPRDRRHTAAARSDGRRYRDDVPLHAISRELALTRTGLSAALLTAAACLGYMAYAVAVRLDPTLFVQGFILGSTLCVLVWGTLVVFVTRLGYLTRRRTMLEAGQRVINPSARSGDGSVVVLVPSYREEARIIRQTLLAAALQEHPGMRVVLLIDDPPNPQRPDDLRQLEAARALPSQIAAELVTARDLLASRSSGLTMLAQSDANSGDALADVYEDVAAWFAAKAAGESVVSHTDRFFVEAVLDTRARTFAAAANDVRGQRLAEDELAGHLRLLAGVFDSRIDSFERKRYVGLSHAANKAMNLNAYIGLLGRRFDVRGDHPSISLVESDDGAMRFDDAEFVLTVDADSIILPRYVPRLLEVMRASGNERVAVAQAPYSSIPGACTHVERIAGATTDLQYVIHQGFTRHRSTFWVGANAVLRKAALDDVMTVEREHGIEVRKYVHDRTVIEDTESSVDLAARGWTLENFPERLAYSATPADFGSLVIQRRRWANGGLIILPKCLRYLRDVPWRSGRVLEVFLRAHYLASIALSNLAFLIVLAVPFDERLGAPWLPLLALPYVAVCARDLRLAGHRGRDVFDVAALNLVLLPVNLGGVVKSLEQAITSRKTPFGRTPKVPDRTPAPALYVLAAPGLALLAFGVGLLDVVLGRPWHAAFAFLAAALGSYGFVRFIGIRSGVADVGLAIGKWRRPEASTGGSPAFERT